MKNFILGMVFLALLQIATLFILDASEKEDAAKERVIKQWIQENQ